MEWPGPWLSLTPHLKQPYSPSKYTTLLEITANAQVPFKPQTVWTEQICLWLVLLGQEALVRPQPSLPT